MNQLTEGCKHQTKRARFTSLMAFFNFAKNNLDRNISNSWDSPMLRNLFRPKVKTHWYIFEKDTVDEIIFWDNQGERQTHSGINGTWSHAHR
jgi:hypothetical protein